MIGIFIDDGGDDLFAKTGSFEFTTGLGREESLELLQRISASTVDRMELKVEVAGDADAVIHV